MALALFLSLLMIFEIFPNYCFFFFLVLTNDDESD